MKPKNLGWLLKMQLLTGRTQSGREIGKSLKDRINGCIASMTDEEFRAIECLNCRVIFQDVDFVDGCPNCGSKDWREFGESPRIEKE